ncbi:DUF1631 domain-containing protein [Pseudoxanthomonas sp. Root630]|uniref:DUF1631 domain-containing protein n=1 Tax=Pseudoxanthomonas sp. Root630 TaxID=1736574 RepID=UPI00070270E0|nr:DUF1631 domain-containing protein [Pseudoxanthomonas sp. Root630]KRA40044.1 hypothetical protein ASD72_16540 [Pseudoxanthomonas sp. Root630]
MTAPRPPSPAAAPTTIASAALPLRVRRVLQNLFDHVSTDFITALNAMLVEFEQQLFKQADQARSNHLQAQVFVDLRALQKHRTELAPHYMFGLEAELAAIRAPRASGDTPSVARLDYQTLTLVEDAVMDQEIVLREVARRHEQRGNAQILMLGQRFGVLAGQPAYEAETLPLGPNRLCHVLKEAAACLDLSLDAQLVLYRTFDQKVMLNYSEWANTVNQFLSREGILPGLVYTPRRVRVQDAIRRHPRDEGDGAARPMTGWNGQGTTSHWATLTPEQLQAVAGAMLGSSLPGTGGGSTPPPVPPREAATPAGDTATAPDNSAGSFEVLQKLLAIRRGGLQADAQALAGTASGGLGALAQGGGGGATGPASGGPGGGGSGSGGSGGSAGHGAAGGAHAGGHAAAAPRLLPTPDVLTALQAMQAAPLPARTPDQPRRTVQDLQQTMLAAARAQHGPHAALASADSDTFELLDLLYNEIEREVQHDAPAADMLVRLQVPVVQAALRDRNFFLRAQHPARDLLNTVAESGATWLGEDDVDPHLVQKLHKAVETVVETYEGDETVFEDAQRDVQQHLQAAVRKAELAERRQVEAARGKDRLEIAKQRAAETIESAMAEAKPQKFVQALLSQAWADVLTLTQLRNGESSGEWADQLQTTLEIVAATTTTAQGANPDLAGKVEKSLVQVGYHEDEAAAIARRLSSVEEDETTSRTELTARLKARARLGGQNEVKKKPAQPRTPQEQECYDYLRTLPFGTWFEFTRNQQGDVQRQRLSWFSPVTGNALFVNQRGQRVGEHSLDTLAHLMAKGQAQVVTEDRGRLIDRAWNATLNALRSLTGRRSDAEPAGDAA